MIDYDFIKTELYAVEQECMTWSERFQNLVGHAERECEDKALVSKIQEIASIVEECLTEESAVMLALVHLHILAGRIADIEQAVKNYGDEVAHGNLTVSVGEVLTDLGYIRDRIQALRALRKRAREVGAKTQ